MKDHGFTLIEVLVALAIVTFIGVMSFTSLMTSLKFNELTLSRMDMSSQLILADELLKRDFVHALNRISRDERGEPFRHSFYGTNPRYTGSDFSEHIGVIRHVEYILENNTIKRIESKFVDQTEETEVSTTILLKDVKSVSLKFSQGNQWVDEWPFLDWTTNNGLPKIVELSYEIEGLGQIMRRYMLPFEA